MLDAACRLLVAVNDAATVEIVRAKLNRDTVAGENANEVHPDLPRNVDVTFTPGAGKVVLLERHTLLPKLADPLFQLVPY